MINGKAYNHNFKMFLEGVEAPFNSADITCTPNGVEAQINIPSNSAIFDLKPKTAVQIFFKEWVNGAEDWLIVFDGFFSRYDKSDDINGRAISIACRDFRMDIRKAPAALVMTKKGDFSNVHHYTMAGIHQTVKAKGASTRKGNPKSLKTFDTSGLSGFSQKIAYIAASASGAGWVDDDDGDSVFSKMFAKKNSLPEIDRGGAKKSDGCFFLDAVARGLWMEASGGTSVGIFTNKRIRVDKRLFIPPNAAGYAMWSHKKLGAFASAAAMGGSMMSSVEAMIMNVAGSFMSRVYSTSTPSLINVNNQNDPNSAAEYAMSPSIQRWLVERQSAEFGQPYILNSSMLLPPTEFTAPPTFNLMFPSMYNRVTFQHDQDVDITRGYFRREYAMKNTSEMGVTYVELPNNVFEPKSKVKNKKGKLVSVKGSASLTLEERYKGVNVIRGEVNNILAGMDSSKTMGHTMYSAEAADKMYAELDEIKANISLARSANKSTAESIAKAKRAGFIDDSEADKMTKSVEKAEKKAESKKAKSKAKKYSTRHNALDSHALFKFLNTKFIGRVARVEMMFNPYIMCGFPGAAIADDNTTMHKTTKTLIGMVQQVRHLITAEGTASTSCVMNSARYIDEPTDIDESGYPVFSPPTNPWAGEVDENMDYTIGNDDHFVANAISTTKQESSASEYFDFKATSSADTSYYVYSKDVLSKSPDDIKDGRTTKLIIDDMYTPNRISKFYKKVFGQENSYMIGTFKKSPDDAVESTFMYDTIHEAITNISANRKDIMTDSESAIKYIKRNICSADAFYNGILGMTTRSLDKDEGPVYTNTKEFDHTSIHSEYYGVSTSDFKKLPNEIIDEDTGSIFMPGDLSSVREVEPLTPFLKERKDAVKSYIKALNNSARNDNGK